MSIRHDVPGGLDAAFTNLCRALEHFWEHAAHRIKDTEPVEHAQLCEFLARGGVIRCVFHFRPQAAIAFELIDADGNPIEFYRVHGKAHRQPAMVN
jgi:hypothetical protein